VGEPNPYQSPAMLPEFGRPERTQAALRATFWSGVALSVLGSLGIVGGICDLTFWGLAKLNQNPFVTLNEESRFDSSITIVLDLLVIFQSGLQVCGAVSMFQRKRRWLALTGAWAGILPMCGCYLISLIAGIWILFILRRPEVKELFAAKGISSTES
jgi:hypothetical protein